MGAILACQMIALAAQARDQSPIARIDALGLESLKAGRITTLFVPIDRGRATQLAGLLEAAAGSLEREFGTSFELRLAVLGPRHWFSPHGGPGMPYGIPWCSTPERLIVVPASLTEGALISGPNGLADRRRVDFVTLHEFGHLFVKAYLHPASTHEELPILWFEELAATYVGYAFVAATDREWAEALWKDAAGHVAAYSPRTRSLDWSFMRTLPAAELPATFAWYQYVLNLRAFDVYRNSGPGFLRTLKEKLPLHSMSTWTTRSLLADLESISPGFQRWASELEKRGKLSRRR